MPARKNADQSRRLRAIGTHLRGDGVHQAAFDCRCLRSLRAVRSDLFRGLFHMEDKRGGCLKTESVRQMTYSGYGATGTRFGRFVSRRCGLLRRDGKRL